MLIREKLVINTAELGNKLPQLISLFRYENPEYYTKKSMKVSVKGIEPTLYHYALEDGPNGKQLILPRGAINKVKKFYNDNNIPFRILDKRIEHPTLIDWKMRSHSVEKGDPINLGQHQLDIIDTLIKHEGGLIQASPGCITGDTIVRFSRAKKGFKISIKKAYAHFNHMSKNSKYNWDTSISTYVRSYNNESIKLHEIDNIVYSGIKHVYELSLENGFKIKATADHLIMTSNGWIKLIDLKIKIDDVMCDAPYTTKSENKKKKVVDREIAGVIYHPFARIRVYSNKGRSATKRMEYHRAVYEAYINNLDVDEYINIIRTDEVKSKTLQFVDQRIYDIHHIDFDHFNNNPLNLEKLTKKEHQQKHNERHTKNFNQGVPYFSKVSSITYVGIEDTYDIICKDPYRNFSANDIIIHNSGKTFSMLGLIEQIKQPTLIIMHEHRLRSQWEAEIKDKVEGNFKLGRLDGDKKIDGDVVVGLFQTATKVMEEDPEWFNKFGMVIYDECHRCSSETYNFLVTNIPAKYRVGITGTVKRSDGLELLIYDMLGPILIDITEKKVKERITKFEPLTQHTDIEFKLPTRRTYQNGVSDVAYDHTKTLNLICADEKRNTLILKNILKDIEEGYFPLVLSDRKEHCREIYNALTDMGIHSILLISDTRKSVKWEEVKSDTSVKCIVAIGKIASEGLDLPRLSSIHLTCPTTNESQIRQKIARVRRSFPDKPLPRVWDYVDNLAYYWRRNKDGEKVQSFKLKEQGVSRKRFYKKILDEYAEA